MLEKVFLYLVAVVLHQVQSLSTIEYLVFIRNVVELLYTCP